MRSPFRIERGASHRIQQKDEHGAREAQAKSESSKERARSCKEYSSEVGANEPAESIQGHGGVRGYVQKEASKSKQHTTQRKAGDIRQEQAPGRQK